MSRSQTASRMSIRPQIALDPSRLSREELEAEVARLRALTTEPGLGRRQMAVLDSTTSFAIVLTDRDGLVTDWNVGAERILGWSAEEMCGCDLARIFTPEDNAIDRAATEMRLSLEHGRADDERWHLRKEGSRFWASGEMMPLRGERGEEMGFVKVLRDRTAEHRAGEDLRETAIRLRESEDHYRHTVELNPQVPWTADPQGNITSYSNRWLELTGQAPGEPLGTGWVKAIHPDDVLDTMNAFGTSLASGEPVDVDYRIYDAAAGYHRWMRARAHPRRDGRGNVVQWYGIVEDIHDRKLAEAGLRASEERYRTLFEAIEAGFSIIEMVFDEIGRPVDYRFVEINPAFERQTGMKDCVGKTMREIAPDHEQHWFDTYGCVALTGEPVRFELPALALGGRWYDVYAFRSGDPALHRVAILFNDVTDRRRNEQALRESEEQFRVFAQAVPNHVWAGTPDGDLYWFNEQVYAYCGVDHGSLDGTAWTRIVHPDDLPDASGIWARSLDTGTVYETEFRIRRADGAYRWFLVRAEPVKAEAGTLVRWVGTNTDIHERKRQAEELALLNETLEEQVETRSRALMAAEDALRQSQKLEAVGQLTGGVAHDFNNLLTIIRSSVDFLRRPDLPEDRRRRYMDAVSDTVDRAAKLTGQLLAFARRQALKPEVFDVGERLRAVADMLDTVTGSRIRVVAEVSPVACYVRADLSQFETALVNMAVNARDAMDGEGRLTLRLECCTEIPAIRGHAPGTGPFAAISLTDTGSGITPETMARIFEPFFTTKEVGKGTGLGLSQVFGFAKQSGGDVDVSSEPGQGTTFTLYLPEVDAEVRVGRQADAAEPVPGGSGQRILVVEDNVEVGRFATQILRDLGYETHWAANAEEALEKLGADGDGFDAVFSDVVMPGMGGVALAEELRRRLPDMPVVLASGYSHVLAQEDSHGFELLNKPYSADQLARVLMRASRRGQTTSS